MSNPEADIKAHIKPKIRASLETVAKEKHPTGYEILDEFEELMEIITIERIRSNKNCSSSLSMPNSPLHVHRVCISVQADFKIRIYPLLPAGVGATVGGTVGTVGGTVGGIAAGAAIGSIVPVAGNIIGGIIGGIVGSLSGFGFGAGVGGGTGAAVGLVRVTTVCASDIFLKLEEYSMDKNHNICRCILTAPTKCPSGDEEPDNSGP